MGGVFAGMRGLLFFYFDIRRWLIGPFYMEMRGSERLILKNIPKNQE